MVKRMLIDATHPEETRVVVVNGTRLEELDVETSTKKQLKGNIYLARVIRVEPSLQAAFVDYGGNRHGFLAFNEIHPDYFQIPVADRKALLAEQRAESLRDGDAAVDRNESDAPRERAAIREAEFTASPLIEGEAVVIAEGEAQESDEAPAMPVTSAPTQLETEVSVETVGGDDSSEEVEQRRRVRPLRNYKIQEVIKRRQILLVQVVKEERGNKGAALTTYLSLAGRYCVLMPNTARGGGVSRKITNASDRRRLKSITADMDIPDGMAVIVRTAGSERTRTEIKRDYEYLLRLWDNVRQLTLASTAPALVYEEANLIKRSIRDLYSRDIEEVLVEGDEGYRAAKDFMRMLTPSHAKKVQPYRDPTMPLLHRFQVESQLDAMHNPVVQLRSGGYIVISPTEALVAIDVNSGRSTKERHIEETALKTNLEAAEEIARQLRLRDLAGLIVIDFIDMEDGRNNAAVERKLKEAMRFDRARIQLGRISPFGLLELSRQRLRPSLQETSFQPCTHCGGTGIVRSVESTAVYVLRAIEEEGIRRRSSEVTVHVPTPVALYILNQKRLALADIEVRYGFRVFLLGDDSLIVPNYRLDRIKAELRPEEPVVARPIMMSQEPPPVAAIVEEDDEAEVEAEETEAEEIEAAAEGAAAEAGEDEPQRRRRRRRKRRGRREEGVTGATGEVDESAAAEDGEEAEGGDEEADETEDAEAQDQDAVADAEDAAEAAELGEDENGEPRKSRRRGKRGGRRRRRIEGEGEGEIDQSLDEAENLDAEVPAAESPAAQDAPVVAEIPAEAPVAAPIEAPAPALESVEAEQAAPVEVAASEIVAEAVTPQDAAEAPAEAAAEEEKPAKPKRKPAVKRATPKKAAAKTVEAPAEAAAEEEKPAKPKRKPAVKRTTKKAAAEEAAQPEGLAVAAETAPVVESPAAEAPAIVTETVASEAPATPEPAPAERDGEKSDDSSGARRRGWWKRAQ